MEDRLDLTDNKNGEINESSNAKNGKRIVIKSKKKSLKREGNDTLNNTNNET